MAEQELRANPFMDRGRWYWRNEHQRTNGPYVSQMEALQALLRSLDKRTRWRKLEDAIREFASSWVTRA